MDWNTIIDQLGTAYTVPAGYKINVRVRRKAT